MTTQRINETRIDFNHLKLEIRENSDRSLFLSLSCVTFKNIFAILCKIHTLLTGVLKKEKKTCCALFFHFVPDKGALLKY